MSEEKNMKKWYKRKWFYFLIIAFLLIAFVVYSKSQSANKLPVFETVKVEKGTLSQTVDATGNVSSANELDLRFEMTGKLSKIYKKVNDVVKAGGVIAELDLGEQNARVSQASASAQRAKANLDKVLTGETNDYITGIKARYDQAKATLDQITANSADAVANAEAVLKTAENNLKLSEGGENSQIVETAYKNLVATIQSVQNSVSIAVTESDNILGIDNVLANDDFEDVLSALDSSKLNNAQNKYSLAKAAKTDLDLLASSIGLSSTHSDIEKAGGLAEKALIANKDLLFAMSSMLDATVPIGDLTQTSLSTKKSTISSTRVDINVKYTTLINQIQAVSDAKSSYSTYSIAYNKAQENYKNAKLRADADIASAQASLAQADSQYNEAKNPARDEDISSARAQYNEALASLSQAVAARNKGRIIAPLDGTIGKIDAKVGEFVSANNPVVKLVNPNFFEIKVDIPETDIIKITVGDEADITLDAYGDDKKFVGKVSQIEIGETVIQDVVYYKVTVSMEDNAEDEFNILNGMTSNVLFYTESKENALFIPQRTIKTGENGKKYVRLVKNGQAEDVYIETGLRGDNGLVEVLSGLNEGDEVVTRENI
ncbi:MAG: efflux RND transporter periplasmic adaptor subunit [Candidatus Magasanikbacteria bacterium]